MIERVEKAQLGDATAIQGLINSFADKGEMLHRPLSGIYEQIRSYFVCRSKVGEVLGCAAIQPLWNDTGEIRAVAVRADYQRQGVGGVLVQACLEDARQLGLPEVFLLTYKPDWFGRFGFKQVDATMKLPRKVWGECPSCPRSPYPDCGEIAMICRLI